MVRELTIELRNLSERERSEREKLLLQMENAFLRTRSLPARKQKPK